MGLSVLELVPRTPNLVMESSVFLPNKTVNLCSQAWAQKLKNRFNMRQILTFPELSTIWERPFLETTSKNVLHGENYLPIKKKTQNICNQGKLTPPSTLVGYLTFLNHSPHHILLY